MEQPHLLGHLATIQIGHQEIEDDNIHRLVSKKCAARRDR